MLLRVEIVVVVVSVGIVPNDDDDADNGAIVYCWARGSQTKPPAKVVGTEERATNACLNHCRRNLPSPP